MFWPISAGTLFGAMMSSERSTFVRRWPSVPDLPAWLGVLVVMGMQMEILGVGGGMIERLTALPVANFFSVPMMAPLRWAWLMAPFPRTTVSR